MTHSRYTNVPLASAIAAVLAGAPLAQSQERPAAGTLEDVIVTATKRTESLQDVPLSIQALGSVQLEELHLQGVNDFVKFLPSVSYQTVGPGFAKIYMRGVSSGGDGNHSGSLPSVGVYLDEQPITTIQGPLDIHLYDIARVESLAGPQGTLFGASSEAGTLRIITNKPDTSGFKAGYDLQGNDIKHGGPGYVLEGFANIPLSEAAAIRLVGWKEFDSGYIDNKPGQTVYPFSGFVNDNTKAPTPTAGKRYNDANTYGGRAALKLDLNDSWTVTPVVQAQQTQANGIFAYNPNNGDLAVMHYWPENSLDHWGQASLTVEGKVSNFDIVYAGAFLRRNDKTHSDYTDYSLGYEILYQQPAGYFYDNAGNAINPTQKIAGKDGYKMFSHELRVSTPKGYPLRATVGAFTARQTHDIEQRYTIVGLADAKSVRGWPNSWWLTKELRVNRDYAVFADVSYDLTSNLTASVGLRHFEWKNSLAGFYGFASRVNGDPTSPKSCTYPAYAGLQPVNGGPCVNINQLQGDSGNTPKVNLSYKFDAEHMLYATYSKGFRPGGVNRVGTVPPYKADFLTSTELGWKSSWLGNRVRFNGAFFLENWKDMQFAFLGPNSVTVVENAGDARIKGVESQLDWAVSGALTLSGGFQYLFEAQVLNNVCTTLNSHGSTQTATCTDSSGNTVPFDVPAGNQLPTTPKFKGDLTARYHFALGDFEAHAQGALVYQSYVWPDLRSAQRALLGRQPAFALLDLALGVERGAYSAELFVNNALDRRAEIFRYTECTEAICGGAPPLPNAVYRGVYAPRMVGIKFGQKF
jgi:iron complex outermembrane receptor protein